MLRAGSLVYSLLVLTPSLFADSNLHIGDVGLYGHNGGPSVVRLIVRNPSPGTQSIRLRVIAGENSGPTSTITSDIELNGGGQRGLYLPVLLPAGQSTITAEELAGNVVIGRDSRTGSRNSELILEMCNADEICKAIQSQIQFSGSIE